MEKETKVCTCCGESKELEMYHKHKTRPDGHVSICKVCARARTVKWNAENKEKKAETAKLLYEKDKVRIAAKAKEYRESHKEEIALMKKRHTELNREAVLANKKAYYEANKETIAEKAKEYRENNKEAIKTQQNACYQRDREKRLLYANSRDKSIKAAIHKKYRDNNPDKVLANRKSYLERHPGRYAASGARKRAKRRKATPLWLSKQDYKDISAVYDLARKLEQESETHQKYHVDHIVPLINKVVCGLHVPWNLQVLTAEDNMHKHNKLPSEKELIRGETETSNN